MEDDYEPQRVNEFIDIPEVSDATVQSMLTDLIAAGRSAGLKEWPDDPEQRTVLRLQIMSAFWRQFGRSVWVRSLK